MSGHSVVVVTGLSGAGKSTALHALEDLGCFCIDNLPIPVVADTLIACDAGGVARVALGIDVRVGSFLDRAGVVLDALRVPGQRAVDILFLDASDETLLRRFSSTRRPHPLSAAAGDGSARSIALLDGIRMERERLAPLRGRATLIIDTTGLSVHDLRRRILEQHGPGTGRGERMATRIVSFGFKYGPPADADLVLDVRFLPNPFFVDALRARSGLDADVRDFVNGSEDTAELLSRSQSLLELVLARSEAEGKSYLTVGVGCTGGRHRSVVLAESLAARLRSVTGLSIDVVHRDLDRDAASSTPGAGGP